MFLVVFTVLLIYIFQGNCFNFEKNNNGVVSNTNDVGQNNMTTILNRNYFLSLLRTTKRVTNLKSNIFDKMLSNEMFSMKQHLFEKDVTSSVYMSFKNNVATPTLEINQKWPIDKVIDKANIKPKFETTKTNTTNISNELNRNLLSAETEKEEHHSYKFNMQESSKKVIEVRSFSVIPNHSPEGLLHMPQQAKRQCTCVKDNKKKLCTHSQNSILNTEKICTHKENDLALVHECTRTSKAYSISLTYFPYYAYPYFVGATAHPFNSYYHPNVLNDLKLPDGKRYKKIKKPYIYEELYKMEDSTDFEGDKDSDDDDSVGDVSNQYDYLENDKSNTKQNKISKHKHKKNPKIFTVTDDNAYEEDSNYPEKLQNAKIKVINRENFVDNVIEDLKVYYNDAVIKDCYCSLSTLRNRSKSTLFLIAFIIYYTSCNILMFI